MRLTVTTCVMVSRAPPPLSVVVMVCVDAKVVTWTISVRVLGATASETVMTAREGVVAAGAATVTVEPPTVWTTVAREADPVVMRTGTKVVEVASAVTMEERVEYEVLVAAPSALVGCQGARGWTRRMRPKTTHSPAPRSACLRPRCRASQAQRRGRRQVQAAYRSPHIQDQLDAPTIDSPAHSPRAGAQSQGPGCQATSCTMASRHSCRSCSSPHSYD